MASIFQKEFRIPSYELNPKGQARLTSMANYFQEMAYFHAKKLGYGYADMKERGFMWILSRVKIHMDKYPEWKDRIIIETWPSGVERLFALRDYRVRNDSGELLGRASTYWLILDNHTHRPIRPKADLERFIEMVHDESVFDTSLKKIDLPEESMELDQHRVSFSDLDIIGHVNNVKYMEWCINTAMRDGIRESEIREFEINFIQEALFGDEIVISGSAGFLNHPDDSGHDLFVATRKADGKEVFRARIGWSLPVSDQAGISS